MSALGHKRTYAVQNVMSALPPKADMRPYRDDVTKDQKQTSRPFVAMSANDPKPASAIAQSVVSRDALDVLRQQFAWRQITEVA
jgi:hypothetical protein